MVVPVTPRADETYSSAIADARNYISWILGVFSPYLRGNILEIGLGHGAFITDLMGSGAYHGIDIDPDAVAASARRYSQGEFAAADITKDRLDTLFPCGAFDAIVCCNVLEHVADDHRAFVSMSNALAPGGHLLVLVPAFPALFNDMDRLAGHHRRYVLDDVRRLTEGLPLEIESSFYFNPIGGMGWWVNGLKRHTTLDSPSINGQILFFDRYVLPISRFISPLTRRVFGQSLVLVARRRS